MTDFPCPPPYDAVIVGGGFFGCSLALHLHHQGQRVIILEMEGDLLQRASYANQARVHAGYHYPRSLLTGIRSRINFPRFVQDFQDCIDDTFAKYYAIGRNFSKVTAVQFKRFCDRIGAYITPAPRHVKALFNPQHIEDVFLTHEYAFDAVKLKVKLLAALQEHQIDIRLNTEALAVSGATSGGAALHSNNAPPCRLLVLARASTETYQIPAQNVYNCTYSRLNTLLVNSHLPPIPLKHELTEIALVEPPPHLKQMGITVMCGPFFSIMPFPPRNLHSFSHVRYTPHGEWHARPNFVPDAYEILRHPPESNYLRMLKDAQRYIPSLHECRYVDSLWEIKTVLPKSEVDDSRPILLKEDYGLPGLTCIMGGKVDNVYDVLSFYQPPPYS